MTSRSSTNALGKSASGHYRDVMSSAEEVANWFVAWAAAEDADLSNMKLQKLLYYAQGHHLGRYGTPLFADPVEAWAHGPVVEAQWRRFRKFESADIRPADADEFDWDTFDPDTTDFLIEVWETYGGFGAWRLRNMTHEEAPWKTTFQPQRNLEISHEQLRTFFARRETT